MSLESSFLLLLITGWKKEVDCSLLESNTSGFFSYSFGLLKLMAFVPDVLPPNSGFGCALPEGMSVDGFLLKMLKLGSTVAGFWKMLTVYSLGVC